MGLKLTINRSEFEMVFEESSDDMPISAYLDIQTGEVILITERINSNIVDEILLDAETPEAIAAAVVARDDLNQYQQKQLLDEALIANDMDNRYRLIPRQDSQAGYQDMETYIATVRDRHLRELLEVAIQGRGAFGRFRNVLYRYPDAKDKWFEFSNKCQYQRMLKWFESEGIEPEFV